MPGAENLGLSFLSLSNYIFNRTQEIQEKVYPDNLSSCYGYIISYLCDNEEKNIFQRDIEKEFDLKRSTVSTILKELEKEGLIERKSVSNDARLKKVIPSEGAKMINEACRKEVDVFFEKLISGINPRDLETFSRVTSVLKIKVENMKKEDKKAIKTFDTEE
ncbi:MAG: MarR family winged helix-turn-helix transcriptional regulator [Eubacterium sp.]